MKNSELQAILAKYPADTEVKLHIGNEKLKEFERENICTHRPDDKVSDKTGGIIPEKDKK